MSILYLACLYLTMAIAAEETQPAGAAKELENFSFVVGEWEGTFKLYPSAVTPKEMDTPAVMVCRWGPQRAWIESQATMEIAPLGSYAAKVLIRFDTRENAYDSFVVNTFGLGARYKGIRNGGKFVFTGKVGDITQRVTYERLSETELLFSVEDSRDSIHFSPHSSTVWHRKELH